MKIHVRSRILPTVFQRRLGHLLNILSTFNLHHVARGEGWSAAPFYLTFIISISFCSLIAVKSFIILYAFT